jgi:hypothetical protein
MYISPEDIDCIINLHQNEKHADEMWKRLKNRWDVVSESLRLCSSKKYDIVK